MWNLGKISIWKCKDKNSKQTKTWQKSKVGLSKLLWQKWVAGAFLEWSCIRLSAGHPPVSAQALKQWFTENFSELLSFLKRAHFMENMSISLKLFVRKEKEFQSPHSFPRRIHMFPLLYALIVSRYYGWVIFLIVFLLNI